VLPEGAVDVIAPPGARAGVLVLHPHPDMGGDRFNPVVDAVWRAAGAAGWAAVRFDFSSSDTTTAVAEATEALGRVPDVATLGVVGYSFGSTIAARLVDPRIAAWVLIAPPLAHVAADGLAAGADGRPKLLLPPVHDQFCPPAAATEAVSGWAATTVEPVDGADHFLAGATSRVADRAIAWLAGDR
jgi:alpha/beta superfamily hydrolase